jgi:hypothetical protein
MVGKRALSSGKDQQIIEECEVDTVLLAVMADLEGEVAIEPANGVISVKLR